MGFAREAATADLDSFDAEVFQMRTGIGQGLIAEQNGKNAKFHRYFLLIFLSCSAIVRIGYPL